jgi:hypothetical protein
VSARTTPLVLAENRRRFAYCVVGALALHASGVLSHWLKWKPTPVEMKQPEPVVVPVSLEDTPPPLPPAPPPPPPPPPPEPAPAALSPLADAPVPRAEPRLEPPKPSAARAPPPPTSPPYVAPSARPDPKTAEDASAFIGKPGAFSANVCFVPHQARSARALEGCKSVAKFSTNAINVSPRRFTRGFPGVERRVEWFGIDYQGRFKVRAAGYYTFRLLSDDGAILFVDGHQVLDNDGQHSVRDEKIAMPLSQGEHEFRLLYYQGPGHSLALQLFVKGYQKPERLFGPEI